MLPQGKGVVLGAGSISGVDLDRFRPDAPARATVRRELAIPDDADVALFLGRLNRDKGVADLVAGFAAAAADLPGLWLILVGPDEEQLKPALLAAAGEYAARLRFVDYTSQPERFISAADIFCMPSYREGFGSSIIEAAACGLPALASRIYGLTDAVVDGVTGLLHTPRDRAAIAAGLRRLASDAALRVALGKAAQDRARNEFPAAKVSAELVSWYQQIR